MGREQRRGKDGRGGWAKAAARSRVEDTVFSVMSDSRARVCPAALPLGSGMAPSTRHGGGASGSRATAPPPHTMVSPPHLPTRKGSSTPRREPAGRSTATRLRTDALPTLWGGGACVTWGTVHKLPEGGDTGSGEKLPEGGHDGGYGGRQKLREHQPIRDHHRHRQEQRRHKKSGLAATARRVGGGPAVQKRKKKEGEGGRRGVGPASAPPIPPLHPPPPPPEECARTRAPAVVARRAPPHRCGGAQWGLPRPWHG